MSHSDSAESPKVKAPKLIVQRHSQSVTEFLLNRPKALNSVDHEMISIMQDELKSWHKDPMQMPRVLIMRGAGDRAFCAGGDIVSLFRARD